MASKGQVWNRHCAPAAPAFTRPSLASRFNASLTGQQMFHWLIVLHSFLPDLGKRQGALWFRALTPGMLCLQSGLGRGIHAVFHVGLLCSWGVLAVAGLTQPHTLRSGSPGHEGFGGEGRSEVISSGRYHQLWCWSLGSNNWVLAFLELDQQPFNFGGCVCFAQGCYTVVWRSGVAQVEFSVLHVMVDAGAEDAALSGISLP